MRGRKTKRPGSITGEVKKGGGNATTFDDGMGRLLHLGKPKRSPLKYR